MSNLQQRDAFFDVLYDLAKNDKNVYLVSIDMSAPSLDKFRKDLSSQYINVGIAEQNGISIASGMALQGKKVYVYGISSFVSTRCLEQIRINCGIMGIPLTIVGVGCGFSYDDAGPTHNIFEDVSLIRAIPNIIINNCTDSIMAEKIALMSYSYKQANYIRLDRSKTDDIYEKHINLDDGFHIFKKGSRNILSTGIMTHTALDIASRIDDLGVIDVHTLPFNNKKMLDVLSDSGRIITMEEHVLNGGLGGHISEFLHDNDISQKLLRIGIKNNHGYCHKFGGREDVIWGYYGIDNKSSFIRIKEFLKEE